MKLKLVILTGVLALQAAWILGTTFVHERALAEGKVVLLETAPVDPRDLLRGDYVILNYKISDVPRSLFSPALEQAPSDGTTVYVALAPQGEFHQAASASLEKVTPTADQVVIQGKVQQGWRGPRAGAVHLVYGLERYYVREGTGDPKGKLTAQVAVLDSGRSTLKQLFIDGQPYAEKMRSMKD